MVFPPLDFFRVQALPQAFLKLNGTAVPAHLWAVHHWSWWVCYPWNLALRGTSLGVKLFGYSQRISTFLSDELSRWTLYTASCRVDLCWTRSHFRYLASSGNLIESLSIENLWSYLPLETVSVPFKKQTFAMSYYIELRCSVSSLRLNVISQIAWCGNCWQMQCWFFDYRNHSPLTHAFPSLGSNSSTTQSGSS